MHYRVTDRIRKVHSPPISEVKQWTFGRVFPENKPLVDLCQAVPSYPPATELTDYLKMVIDDPQTSRYSPDEGLPEVREAVCQFYGRMYGANIQPKEVALTIGASQAFWLCMTALCSPGDEVILQLPYYFDHAMGLDTMGIKRVHLPFRAAEGGIPDPDELESLITEKTKAILLVSPSNPTGAIIPPKRIDELFECAAKHRIPLILDETYNAFICSDGSDADGDGSPHNLFSRPDWHNSFIHIASFGKTLALTGYRSGALIASPQFIHQILKAQDAMVVCQPRITQLATAYGLDHLQKWIDSNRLAMHSRHNLFRDCFNNSDTPFALTASGGFFAWVRHPFSHMTGREVSKMLADRANVITLPGEVFGEGLEGYLRLAFGNIADEDIHMVVERFRSI